MATLGGLECLAAWASWDRNRFVLRNYQRPFKFKFVSRRSCIAFLFIGNWHCNCGQILQHCSETFRKQGNNGCTVRHAAPAVVTTDSDVDDEIDAEEAAAMRVKNREKIQSVVY